ncbi:phosphoenolpyruvate--protein phosphotransferase [Ruminococcaceae bacterium OttesenSCG-928-A16]|nr:phosphoenolpyruvate--protein phosphotransferase [Ruminococcaceae bacterium OttesenSCG-928-A16]
MIALRGKSVCVGVAIGQVFVYRKPDIDVSDTPAENPTDEWARFLAARQLADTQLAALYAKTLDTLGPQHAEIFDVHRMMLEDPDYTEAVQALITNDNKNAAWAVLQTGQQFAGVFAGLEDAYMKDRATDVLDISNRLVEILLGSQANIQLTSPAIIMAEDLTPSETVQIDKDKILAFVTRQGSANSHTAILARTMNIPSVVQVEVGIPLAALHGKTMVVNGFTGECFLDPDEATLAEMKNLQQQHKARRNALEKMRGLASTTKGGRFIHLYANIGSAEDLPRALAGDAEGIGLFRSEFLYLGRSTLPSEEEQFEAYKKVAEGMQGKKVIIRTMDIGADKQAAALHLEREENPALGYRALRICLDRPELFKTQLRAIYRASVYGNIAIMFPMVASLWEVQACKQAAKEAREELNAEGIPFGAVEIGIMIETPAAVMLADELAKEVEFFSVGTNDLTQYTLAIDRQNAKLDRFYNPHHPAILKMLQMVVDSAHRAGIWAGICGELAADTSLTETFLQMGFDELSVTPGKILELRSIVRESPLA